MPDRLILFPSGSNSTSSNHSGGSQITASKSSSRNSGTFCKYVMY